MIKEFWHYLTTQTQLVEARKMGFLHEAIAMAARRERCFSAWQRHYQQCQQAILRFINSFPERESLVILGAGSLMDIPLPRLANEFQKVILVDVVFLKESRELASRYPNVELVEREITGWCEPILNREVVKPSRVKATVVQIEQAFLHTTEHATAGKNPKNAHFPSPAVQLVDIWAENRVSGVVSLNLITQIPLIPVRWLMEKHQLPEALAGEVGKAIVQQHLHFLQTQGSPVCLIADREDQEFNREGRVIDQWDPTWEVSLPEAESQWEWVVMPIGEYSKEKGQKNVVGVSFLSGAG